MGQEKIKIVITADGKQYAAAIDKATGKTRELGAANAATAKSMGLARQAAALLTPALGGLALGKVASDTVRAAVTMEKYSNTLKAATGSAEGASEALAFVSAEADRIGIAFTTSAESFAQLAAAAKGTALEGQGARDIFTAVAEASRVMGLSAAESEGALRAIAQMMNKGTVQAEELRGQLGERIPGAVQIAARAMKMNTAELGDMMKKGELLAEDLLPRLAVELRKSVSEGLLSSQDSAAANFERMGNAVFELEAQFGRTLLPTLTEFTKYLSGTVLPAWQDWLEKIGLIKREANELELFQIANRIGPLQSRLAEINKGLQFGTPGGLAPGQVDEGRRVLMAERDKVLAALAELKAEERKRLVAGGMLPALPTNAAPDVAPATEHAPSRQAAAEAKALAKRAAAEAKALERTEAAKAAAAERQRQRLDSGVDRFIRSLDTELEAEQRRYEEGLSLLEHALTQEADLTLNNKQDILAAIDRLETDHAARIAEIHKRQAADQVTEQKKAFREIEQTTQQWSNDFQGIMLNTGDGWRGMVDSMLRDIERLAFKQATDPLTGLLNDAIGGLFGGISGGASASAAAPPFFPQVPGRAAGGPVAPGGTYVVGERGPELLHLGAQGGAVTPNGAAQSVRVEMVNSGAPKAIQEATATVDPRGIVVSMLVADVQGGGPVSGALARTFGLRRGG